MVTITDTIDFILPERTVVAIGKFDGDHLGHQKIFEEMRRIRDLCGLKIAAFTFVWPDRLQIASNEEKHRSLEKEGIDFLVEYPFTDEIRMTSGEDFLKNVLVEKMKMAWIVAGKDCSFGYNKSGNAALLKQYADIYDYKVTFIDKIKADDTDISSTRIRSLLSDGSVDKILELKGEYYSITGKVIHNKQLGRTIGFPTVNIIPSADKFLPRRGVYATQTHLEDGQIYLSMTNIGYNPTVEETNLSDVKCETHIFDFDRDIYGQTIKVDFIKFIREEQKFSSLDELINQLNNDKSQILQAIKYERGNEMSNSKIALGIEFGSTRIKSVLIDMDHKVLASGSYTWENELVNNFWTYKLEDAIKGLQASYADLSSDYEKKYGKPLTDIDSIGISGMMHGYIALDKDNKQLFPFLTWRNTNTGKAADKLSELLDFNMPMRWSVSHLYEQILENAGHVSKISHLFTLAGYIHYLLSGKKIVGIDEASGMFPFDCENMCYDSDKVSKFDELIADKAFPWKLLDILPQPVAAGCDAGKLTEAGAKLIDPSGNLKPGCIMAPPEGDAATGMVCTNAVEPGTANLSAGTSTFLMLVLEKNLSKVYREIDIVNTPGGKPVAMIHLGNGASEIDAWVNIFRDMSERAGQPIDISKIYDVIFNAALEGDADADNIIIYNYLAGEAVMDCPEGRPLMVRKPESKLTLPNFMRSNIYGVFAAIASKNKIFDAEGVKRKSLTGHGGLFKTTNAAQKFLSAALNVPVTVNINAGEGGPYGMALLAAYQINKDADESIDDYLRNKVFSHVESTTVMAAPEEVSGYAEYLKAYESALKLEQESAGCLK